MRRPLELTGLLTPPPHTHLKVSATGDLPPEPLPLRRLAAGGILKVSFKVHLRCTGRFSLLKALVLIECYFKVGTAFSLYVCECVHVNTRTMLMSERLWHIY